VRGTAENFEQELNEFGVYFRAIKIYQSKKEGELEEEEEEANIREKGDFI
jgi:hypothetical protein